MVIRPQLCTHYVYLYGFSQGIPGYLDHRTEKEFNSVIGTINEWEFFYIAVVDLDLKAKCSISNKIVESPPRQNDPPCGASLCAIQHSTLE